MPLQQRLPASRPCLTGIIVLFMSSNHVMSHHSLYRLALKTSLGLQDWKQASVMFAARDRGALIFEAFSNSPPWFMTISGVPRCVLNVNFPVLIQIDRVAM